MDEFTEKIDAAAEAFYAAEAELPAGDPEIDRLREAWFALLDDPERQNLLEELDDIKGTGDVAAATGASAAGAANAALAIVGTNDLTNLITSASAAANDLGTSLLTGATNTLTSGINTVNKLAGNVTSLVSSASTAVSAVTGQGATALTALQKSASVAPNEADINNSIAGLIGNVTVGPTSG